MSLIVKHKFEKSKPFFNHKFHFCVIGKSAKKHQNYQEKYKSAST